ncbi:MAG: hypothetical protein AAFY20_10600 [Cyanobacteria bacterium J06639_14]
MNFLLKFRPGIFGLLVLAIAVSTCGQAAFKARAPVYVADSRNSQVTNKASVPTDESEATPEEPEVPELTYYDYQIEVELRNLMELIKAEARDRIDADITAEQINGSLAQIADEPATPESTARKLYLLRALQTIKDGEVLPEPGPITTPTIEDYRHEIIQAKQAE